MLSSRHRLNLHENRCSIAEAGERLEILKSNLAKAQVKTETPSQQKARLATFQEPASLGVDYLWTLDERSINQHLHGNLRLAVRDGEIIALELRQR